MQACVTLLWLPLGAGGVGFVRLNGRVYERIAARRAGRSPQDLYHTALEVRVAEARYVVENAWPSPDAETARRGVLVEGPVFHPFLGRYRPFRYEVRCWRDGVIADDWSAVRRDRVSSDPGVATALLDSVAGVPPLVWGRRVQRAAEMWNSNSAISYLLAKTGIDVESVVPPAGGRAPGWATGVEVARSGGWPRSAEHRSGRA